MADFTIRRGDLLPVIVATLSDEETGVAVNLTGATVRFRMKAYGDDPPKINAPAIISNAVNGVVRYEWAGTDTDTVGGYIAEWQITWPGAKTQTFPSDGYLSIEIMPDIR